MPPPERSRTDRPHFGVVLHAHHASWDEVRRAALRVEELGYDSVWAWDHFVPLHGDVEQGPMLEGWQILAAWGALTTRIRLGTLVTGVQYRHPAVVANMVATLDHITHGRAVLGLGAGWHQREHTMYGIPFGTWTERFDRLEEACAIIRSLLDHEVTTHRGRYYRLSDAIMSPKPVQPHLPLMIGGGGERRTLRIVARWADMWHTGGNPDVYRRKVEVLERHCREAGRDPATILRTVTIYPGVTMRDDTAAVEERLRGVASRARMRLGPDDLAEIRRGSAIRLREPGAIAQRMIELWDLGARGFLLESPAPYDLETFERFMRDVPPRFGELSRARAASAAAG